MPAVAISCSAARWGEERADCSNRELRTAAVLAYYGLTSGVGRPTPGEERCDLTLVRSEDGLGHGRLPPATVPRPQGWRAGADTSGASATAAAHGRTESVLLLAAERSAGAVREYSSPMGGRHAMLAEQAEMLANSGDITATRRRGETLRHVWRKRACTQLPLGH